jgi:hypothetical protein
MKTICFPGTVQINSITSDSYRKFPGFAGDVYSYQYFIGKIRKRTKWHLVRLVLPVIMILISGNIVLGQDTGLKSPTTSQVLAGTIVASNSLLSDNIYTAYAANGDAARFGGFGLTIPAGVTIVGIQVQLEGNRTTTFQTQRDLNISLTWDNGTTYTAETTMTRFTNTSDAIVSVGGATSLWGRTWALSDFTDANFGVRCRVPAGANNTINIDLIQVRVYYQCNTAAPTVSTPVTYCQNVSASPLTAGGTDLLWYTLASDGTGSPDAPTPVTTAAGTISHWVSQTVGCEGPRAKIDVIVHPSPISSVIGQTNITCNAAADGTITVSASSGTPPYQFSVNEGATFQDATSGNTSLFTGLSPNTPYKIKVRDVNGCYSK